MAKLSNDYYCEYVEKCWKQHEDAMRPTHQAWREMWQLYQNKQDFSKKMNWQSKCFIPKIMMQVEKTAGEVKRAILQTNKLFKFELNDEREQEEIQQLKEAFADVLDPSEQARIQRQMTLIKRRLDARKSRMLMREKQFKQLLAETEFVNVYSEMMKSCSLLGLGIPKVIWSDDRPKFEHLDAMNFAVSPDYVPHQKERAPFMIERQEMPLAEFRQRVKRHRKVWDAKEVKKIEEDAKKLDRFNQQRTRRGYGDYSDIAKRIELKFFWGDVIDKDDEKIEENMLLVVANGKYLVRKQTNPFTHEYPPFVPTIPMVYPHRATHGISLVAPQVKLQYTVNNIVNMFMDNLHFSIIKMFEYNPNDLLDPNAMNTMYPGKMIAKNTPAGQQAIQEITTTAIKRDVLYFYELIDREMQEGTGITEFISGLPGKKSKTLGEVERKTAESRGLFDTIGRDLEMNSLKPLLERAYDLCTQFKGWEPRDGNYLFVVSGLTIMLMTRELTQRISQILMMALQAPPLAQMTDIPDLWKQLLATYNLSSVYKEPSEQAVQMNPQQRQQIQGKAEEDARQTVARMSPEQIERMTG